MPAAERYELPPERLGRWLERWAEAHGGTASEVATGTTVTFTAADGAVVECEPPFPPLRGDLLEHVARERTVGAPRHRDVGTADELEHAQRVVRRLVERLVAVDGGDAEQLHLRAREREEERELTAGFAGAALLLVLAGGGLGLRWFGRLT